MKNCRNCKWAAWQKASNGRRLFGNWAECTFPVDVKLPASRSEFVMLLKRRVGVRGYQNIEVECPTWEREEKAKK